MGSQHAAHRQTANNTQPYWQELLDAVPQRAPFRFIDEIIELSDEHIVATANFAEDADFYRGHFPGRPITPGVILVEAMAQAGVVALGIHVVARQRSLQEARRLISVFTDAEVEFSGMVPPGERVVVTGRLQFYRHRKIRVYTEMHRADGSLACSGTLAGMGVPA